eukprot:1006254-Amphidinium_carterae.1
MGARKVNVILRRVYIYPVLDPLQLFGDCMGGFVGFRPFANSTAFVFESLRLRLSKVASRELLESKAALEDLMSLQKLWQRFTRRFQARLAQVAPSLKGQKGSLVLLFKCKRTRWFASLCGLGTCAEQNKKQS